MLKDAYRRFSDNLRIETSYLLLRNVSLYEKISFILRKYYAILLNKRKIRYLDSEFFYDNRFIPAMLQTYPREINNIDKAIGLLKIKTVLDVGANIGQFSFTLKKLFPHLEIYSFEPNNEIFALLEKNSGSLGIQVYNCAIGSKTGKKTFFYSTDASAEGSFIKENLSQNYLRKDVKKIQVDMLNLTKKNLKKLNIPQKIDLLKIDAEGAEIEVLKSLKELNFNYLYIEISVKREGKSSIKEIKGIIREIWGKEAILIYSDVQNEDAPAINVLFELQ